MTFKGKNGTIGKIGIRFDGGDSSGKQSNMSKRVEILSGIEITRPKAFLIGSLETGIVPFTFGTEIVNGFEVFGLTVDGEPVIIRNSNRYSAAMSFLTIVPFRVIDRTKVIFGAFERAAELAASTVMVMICTVTAHS